MIDVEMLRPTADEMLGGLSAGEKMKKRLLFQAKAVDRLPEITGEMLGGLRATPALRHRILLAATRANTASAPAVRSAAQKRPLLARLTPAISMAAAVTLMVVLGSRYVGLQPEPVADTPPPTVISGMDDYRAGTSAGGMGIPQYKSLFAGENTANPPLIGVNGRFYRMLTSPAAAPASLMGATIAEVLDFTEEPSLAGTVGVVSNVAPVGTKVYAVEGLSSKTVCLAEVDGSLRVFQRVGYASETILGNEMFEDTLAIHGEVEMLELSGVGIITNEVDANELIYTLMEFAVYNGDEIAHGNQALTIYLKNGLSLQLAVQGDVLGGCGAWACPEFFQEFQARMTPSSE